MPTVPEAKAPFGSTQRPVQEILLMAPLSVPFASLSSTSIAFGVLKAAFLPSAERSSTPSILKKGQYSQSQLRARRPVLPPSAIARACDLISSKLLGGLARPPSLFIVLL